jgi:hypothetical protein
MTSLELAEIVEQRMDDPAVVGRLACNLRRNEPMEQCHRDERKLSISWQDSGDFWRCTIIAEGAQRVAQVDLHENATVRIDVFEPCRVTVSPEDGILCLTRYKSA